MSRNSLSKFETALKKRYGDKAKTMTEEEHRILAVRVTDESNAARLYIDVQAFVLEQAACEEQPLTRAGSKSKQRKKAKSATYVVALLIISWR